MSAEANTARLLEIHAVAKQHGMTCDTRGDTPATVAIRAAAKTPAAVAARMACRDAGWAAWAGGGTEAMRVLCADVLALVEPRFRERAWTALNEFWAGIGNDVDMWRTARRRPTPPPPPDQIGVPFRIGDPRPAPLATGEAAIIPSETELELVA